MKFSFHSPYIRFLSIWILLAVALFFAWHVWAPLDLANGWELLIMLNVASFFLFGFDKIVAGQGIKRVPEKMLYVATFLGGSAGALIAMHVFHHKTKKLSFQLIMAFLILIQIGVVWLWYVTSS